MQARTAARAAISDRIDCLGVQRDWTIRRGRVAESNSDPEAALLERMTRGDQRALASLYDRLAPLAYGLALRIVGDPRLAQDAVQEAFLRVWQRADAFKSDKGRARAWLLRIVRKATIDQRRSEQARRRAETRAGTDSEAQPPEGPDALFLDTERAASVRCALDELPIEQRHVLEIAYFQGLSHSEIAARESLPLGTVKTRIRDGVLRLRQMAAEGKIHV